MKSQMCLPTPGQGEQQEHPLQFLVALPKFSCPSLLHLDVRPLSSTCLAPALPKGCLFARSTLLIPVTVQAENKSGLGRNQDLPVQRHAGQLRTRAPDVDGDLRLEIQHENIFFSC